MGGRGGDRIYTAVLRTWSTLSRAFSSSPLAVRGALRPARRGMLFLGPLAGRPLALRHLAATPPSMCRAPLPCLAGPSSDDDVPDPDDEIDYAFQRKRLAFLADLRLEDATVPADETVDDAATTAEAELWAAEMNVLSAQAEKVRASDQRVKLAMELNDVVRLRNLHGLLSAAVAIAAAMLLIHAMPAVDGVS